MYRKIFIDANIILDIIDPNRKTHLVSLQAYRAIITAGIEIYTSCDIITTLYYLEAKKDKTAALLKILNINKTITVIEFSNKELHETCTLMLQDSDYADLEDTLQYTLAHKLECEVIITNDQKFISKDIELLTSAQYCERFKI